MNLATKDQTLEFHSVTDAIAQMFCQTYAPGSNVKVINFTVSFEIISMDNQIVIRV